MEGTILNIRCICKSGVGVLRRELDTVFFAFILLLRSPASSFAETYQIQNRNVL